MKIWLMDSEARAQRGKCLAHLVLKVPAVEGQDTLVTRARLGDEALGIYTSILHTLT